ncbi:mitochondrial resolvase Ydc2 [Xylaria cubensis]|nr:mitochondrial resolvase Ydc2 [Xylaria cubensis]
MTASSLSVIPRSLRVEQLKRLSSLCGLPVGGRKEELITRLNAAVGNPPLPSKSRAGPVILSIDLGIRNLAFSLLAPVPLSVPVSRKANPKSKKNSGANPPPSFLGTSPPTIKLHAWQRLSLLENPTGVLAQKGDEDALDVDTTTGVFAPAALAKTANTFLQETVLRFKPLPTHILIERQRWRSGGGSTILEWTVRVNTLEAMLHASLRTLRDVGIWKGEVLSVRPELVGQLFLDAEGLSRRRATPKMELEEDETSASTTKPRRKRTTSTETKKLKIELLNQWLSHGDLIVQPGTVEAGHMLDAYRDVPKGSTRSRSKRVTKEDDPKGDLLTLDKKLDDLTDSLMQGMAWLRWQENIALLRTESGVEQLLGQGTKYA